MGGSGASCQETPVLPLPFAAWLERARTSGFCPCFRSTATCGRTRRSARDVPRRPGRSADRRDRTGPCAVARNARRRHPSLTRGEALEAVAPRRNASSFFAPMPPTSASPDFPPSPQPGRGWGEGATLTLAQSQFQQRLAVTLELLRADAADERELHEVRGLPVRISASVAS